MQLKNFELCEVKKSIYSLRRSATMSATLFIVQSLTVSSQPTAADVPIQVVDLGPDQDVILVYNCFYMRDICRNVGNFRQYPRGQTLHPRSGLSNDRFGYDFSNRRIPGVTPGRKNRRRSQSCPDSWKNTHPCPEPDQREVMRDDGQWFSNALEPGTTVNQIIDLRLPFFPIWRSGLRYSCDEFPPATWVEGGNGENNDDPGETRCAAMRCGGGVPGRKSEQDCELKASKLTAFA